MREIDYYVVEAEKMDPATFAKTYPSPVLLYRGAGQSAAQEEEQTFKTQLLRLDLLRKPSGDAVETDSVKLNTVFEALKRPGGLYPNRISIGRTKTNDIHLPLRLVSKFHAYLAWNEARTAYTLTDAGATNGTKVLGKVMSANSTEALVDGADVEIGPYHFKFFMPKGLYNFAKSLPAF
jgi:uncharacterized protein (DUF1501 family)